MATDNYQQALLAAQAGDQKLAYHLFKELLLDDPSCLQAWVWMSKLVDDPELQRECLQRALLLDPSNAEAREGIDLLQLREAVSETQPPAGVRRRPTGRKLGAYLVEHGYITQEQLDDALGEQQTSTDEHGQRMLLGDILVRRGWLTVRALATAIVMQQEELVSLQENSRPQYLGEYLVRQGLLTVKELRDLLVEQARLRQVGKHIMLGQLLIYGGHVTPPILGQVLEQQRQDFLSRFEDREHR